MQYELSNWALIASAGMLSVGFLVSWGEGLKIEKELLVGAVRAFVQLMIMGYVIHWLFVLDNLPVLLLMLLAMAVVSGATSARRARHLEHPFIVAAAGILAGSLVSLGLMTALGALALEGRVLIPVGGMVIGTSMRVASLCLNRLASEAETRRPEIEFALALGASGRQASARAVRETLKAALIPAMDGMKTLGIIHLPGMMSGLILAGISPLDAVKYQLLVHYLIVSSQFVTGAVVVWLSRSQLFTKAHQLKPATV